MKKLLIPAIVLILLFATILFMNCEEEEVNPFIGTWEWSTDEFTETFEFTENTVTIISFSNIHPDPIIRNGTYQYYDTVIILRFENWVNIFADYSIRNNELTMTFSQNNNTSTYIKK